MTTSNLSKHNEKKVPNAKPYKFGLVVAEWNENITEGLCQGAIDTLLENGALKENIIRWNVPGSFELVYGCKKMIESQEVDAVIAIGSVIQGETKHFDFVCQGVSYGIAQLNVLHHTPVIFCVLTDYNLQQAYARSGGKHGNKGVESAVAAIKMASLV